MLQVFGWNRKSRIFVIRELFQNRFSYRLYTILYALSPFKSHFVVKMTTYSQFTFIVNVTSIVAFL